MIDLKDVKDIVQKSFPESFIDVQDMTGGKDHIELFVASDKFKGVKLLDQHKMVYEALKEEMQYEIHALKLKTMTFEKYQENLKNE